MTTRFQGGAGIADSSQLMVRCSLIDYLGRLGYGTYERLVL